MTEPSLSLRVVRPDDLLVVRMLLFGLVPASGGRTLQPTGKPPQPVLVLELPYQHASEQALPEGSPARPLTAALAARPTRLAFALPRRGPFPFTLEALLGLAKLPLRVAPNALPPGASVARPLEPGVGPGPLATCIELPWRLLLSPDRTARWWCRHDPFTSDGRTEVWHAVLRAPVPVTAPPGAGAAWASPPLRALARRPMADVFDPDGTSVPGKDLDDLVTLTANYDLSHGVAGVDAIPEPLKVGRLVLSGLGATARLAGRWSYPPDDMRAALAAAGAPLPELQSYAHEVGAGRDQFVRLVHAGHLSTGHRASLVDVSERRYEREALQVGAGAAAATAYLRSYQYLVVNQPELEYEPLASGYRGAGREFPFRKLRITTTVTPHIAPAGEGPFWVQLQGGEDFEFGIVATGWDDREVALSTPLMYVPDDASDRVDEFMWQFQQGPVTRRQREVWDQEIAFAKGDGLTYPSRTRTTSLTFGLRETVGDRAALYAASYSPSFLPVVESAEVSLRPVEELTGARQIVSATFHDAYLADGLAPGANPAGVFLELAAPVPVEFVLDRGGGIARPDTAVTHVSTTRGALPGSFLGGGAPIEDAFGGAKLFGILKLTEVIDPGAPPAPADFMHEPEQNGPMAVPLIRTQRVEDGVETRFAWKPRLRSAPPFVFAKDSELLLDVRQFRPDPPGAPVTAVQGSLTGVTLSFADVIAVTFERLRFSSENGRKPDLTAEGADIRFLGELEFVNTLRQVFPGDGFSDPPAVQIDADGISAGYSIAVPTVPIGAFTLQNLAVSTALAIPFRDRPASLRLAISERHHPFVVTVSLFGGGGFFAVAVSAKDMGVEAVEASVEFGGAVALDLGVASGSVQMMGGVYFALVGQGASLTGYGRYYGHFSVLGLVSLTLEFYLGLSYAKNNGQSEVVGQATLQVSVSVAFVHKTVSASLERHFSGSVGDPTFTDSFAPADWGDYCAAFAREVSA